MLTTLFIAIITDESPIVAATREEVITQVADYARERWDTDDPIPDTNDMLVADYFRYNEDEFLKITEHSIEIPFACPKLSIMGPDGITLHPESYESLDELVRAAANFPLRFLHQGYYAGIRGRQEITDLPNLIHVIFDDDDDQEYDRLDDDGPESLTD